MKTLTLTYCLLLLTISITAQTTLSGVIIEKESDETIESATLAIFKNGIYIANTSTDENGIYSIHLDPGIYDIESSKVGIMSLYLKNVLIVDGKINPVNISLEGLFDTFCSILTFNYKIPLIDINNTSSTGIVQTPKTIKQIPTKNIHEISATTAGVSLQ